MPDRVISPPDPVVASTIDHSRRQLEALLEVSEAIAQQRDLPVLFHELAARLHAVVEFDFLTLVLHDSERNVMRLHILETRTPVEKPAGAETSIDGHPAGWVWRTQQSFVVSDIAQETRFPEFMSRLQENHVRSFALIPLTTAQRRLGALGFGRLAPQSSTEGELQFMQRVASQIAVAVDNALNFESSQAFQKQMASERDRLQVLLDVNNALVTSRELPELFRSIATTLERVIHHDYTSLALLDPETGLLKIHALDFPGRPGLIKHETVVPRDASPSGRAMTSGHPVIARGVELEQYPSESIRILRGEGVQVICCVPLMVHGRTFGSLNLACRRLDAFTSQDVELLRNVSVQIAIAVENALAFKEIDALKDKLSVEKLYLEEELRNEFNFEEIIGESHALKRALAQVELAAPATTTVLILGETGTGKELIARAIHNLSPRRARTFVKINCAAVPGGLLESELFGHERGAFTGALAQRIGRFELADKGTLFLDEVGDIPLELQPKLLRVLQEQEFERLGNNRTHRVDVRVVAATNGDLAKLVEEHKFRSDLYYRLNVFPVHIPPLRERPEDVPLLVRYFVQKCSRRLNKIVEYVPADAMDALVNYNWPGNVRELENLIERAVLLSSGKELRVPVAELSHESRSRAAAAAGVAMVPAKSVWEEYSVSPAPETSNPFPPDVDGRQMAPNIPPAPGSIATLDEAERQHILRALRQTKWRIAGPKGAAAMLGMKRTTLQARMQKLGIRRPI